MIGSPLRRWLFIGCLGVFLALFGTAHALDLEAAEVPDDVDITADDMEFDPESKVLNARGHVLIVSGPYKVTAENGHYNTESGDFSVTGNVHFEQEGEATWDGDALSGNLKENTIAFGEYKATLGEWLAKGKGAQLDAAGTLTLQKSAITTCEDWWLAATRFVHHKDGSFTAYHVTYRVFGVPVFYWPEVSGNTNDMSLPFGIEVGYDGKWGVTVFIYKDFRVTDSIKTRAQLEARTARGYGVSNWWEMRTPNTRTDAWLHGYHDDDPLSDRSIAGIDYNLRFETEDWRYRLGLDHRSEWVDDEALTFRAHADLQSDPDLLYEYFRDSYRDDPQPSTFADLAYLGDRVELALYARIRANDFETVVERAPELRLFMPRQDVFGSILQYQGDTTAGYLRMRWADYDLARLDAMPDQDDYESGRIDSLHAFYLPVHLGWFNLVPRAAFRVTAYENTSETPISDAQLNNLFAINRRRADYDITLDPTSFDDEGGSAVRLMAELGIELNTKFYGTWNDFENKTFGISGLRHIVVPYINYTYIPEPTEDKEDLPFFDSVDRLDEAHFIRLGVIQRFQTRRDGRIHTFAKVETFADFHVETADRDRDGLGDLGLAVEFAPTESVRISTRGMYDIDEGEVSTFMASLSIGRPRSWFFSVDYFYRNEFTSRYAYSMASDLTQILYTTAIPRAFGETHHVGWRLTVPLNTRTRVNAYQFYDIDAGEFDLHGLSLEHDFRCWSVALVGEEDSGVLSFAVKVALLGGGGVDADRPSVTTVGY